MATLPKKPIQEDPTEVMIAARLLSASNRPAAGAILRTIARKPPSSGLGSWPPALVAALVEAGAGPILAETVTREERSTVTDMVRGADLTARLLMEGLFEGVEEILRAAGPDAASIVLLKGIATSQRHYPKPYTRLMGDVDLLVPPALHPGLHTILRDLGYVQRSLLPPEFFENHHHSMPFFHPGKEIWVELHRALFPQNSRFVHEHCFGVGSIAANTILMAFRGISTRCLRDELHLIYTCAHWAASLDHERGLVPIVDVLQLLAKNSLDWSVVLASASTGAAGRSLALMLGYLASRGAIELDPRVAEFVARYRTGVGRINTWLLYRLIDHYLVERRPGGRVLTELNRRSIWETLLRERPPYRNLLALPLAVLFPPDRPDRFDPALAVKRALSLLRPRS